LSGRGLCDELITRPEESYRLWRVVVCDLETSRMGAPYIYIYIDDISSLRIKTLKSHTKTLKIRPYMFRSPLKPSSGGPWPYFAMLLNWNVDLLLL